jgi:AraC-like DNA-binding protein
MTSADGTELSAASGDRRWTRSDVENIMDAAGKNTHVPDDRNTSIDNHPWIVSVALDSVNHGRTTTMHETIVRAVERSIETMREHLDEKLTVDDLARSAMFSRFHFSRVFQRATGVSPRRFLSAMRLEEAKRLLLSTSIMVVDIGHQVGYDSVGTFSSRFRSSVGVSPIAYRQLRGVLPSIPSDDRPVPASETSTVRGRIHGPALGTIFVGLFPGRIPEGPPVSYAVLPEPGPFVLSNVPSGTWYLTAHAVPDAVTGEVRHVGCHGPITTRSDTAARLADVQLRQVTIMDPPVLLALPDLRPAAALEVAV